MDVSDALRVAQILEEPSSPPVAKIARGGLLALRATQSRALGEPWVLQAKEPQLAARIEARRLSLAMGHTYRSGPPHCSSPASHRHTEGPAAAPSARLHAVVGRWTAVARRSSFLCSVAACSHLGMWSLREACRTWAACGMCSESGGVQTPWILTLRLFNQNR